MWLRGLEKVRKRYLMQAAAHDLGIVMRKLFGVGHSAEPSGVVFGRFRAAVDADRAVDGRLEPSDDRRPPLRTRRAGFRRRSPGGVRRERFFNGLLNERREYILPVRFDKTAIPGVRSTVGYLDLANRKPEELVR